MWMMWLRRQAFDPKRFAQLQSVFKEQGAVKAMRA